MGVGRDQRPQIREDPVDATLPTAQGELTDSAHREHSYVSGGQRRSLDFRAKLPPGLPLDQKGINRKPARLQHVSAQRLQQFGLSVSMSDTGRQDGGQELGMLAADVKPASKAIGHRLPGDILVQPASVGGE